MSDCIDIWLIVTDRQNQTFEMCAQMLARLTQIEAAAGSRRLTQLQSLAAWFEQTSVTITDSDQYRHASARASSAAYVPSIPRTSHPQRPPCSLAAHSCRSIHTTPQSAAGVQEDGDGIHSHKPASQQPGATDQPPSTATGIAHPASRHCSHSCHSVQACLVSLQGHDLASVRAMCTYPK